MDLPRPKMVQIDLWRGYFLKRESTRGDPGSIHYLIGVIWVNKNKVIKSPVIQKEHGSGPSKAQDGPDRFMERVFLEEGIHKG